MAARLGPGAPAGLPPSPSTVSSRARVLDAAFACVARFGVTKTTVEDVAREARLSRATLYRVFPGGRDELIGALISREVDSFFSALATRMDECSGIGERLGVFLTSSSAQLADHDALRVVLGHEPELVLPFLSFTNFESVLEVFADFLEPYLSPPLEAEDARRVGEWLVRLVLSLALCPPAEVEKAVFPGVAQPFTPTRPVRLEQIPAETAGRLVKSFLLPGIEVLVARGGRGAPSEPAFATSP